MTSSTVREEPGSDRRSSDGPGRESSRRQEVLPLIGIAAAKTPQQQDTGRRLPFDGCVAYGTTRCADSLRRYHQPSDFVRRPAAKTVPLRIVAPPHRLALAADRALRLQVIVAAVQLLQP